MKKYVAYYRVSTKSQGESGLGLDAQKSIVKHFAKDDEIVEEFEEIASGGSADDRPKLQQAIQLCKKEGCYLIVAKTDRLSRNVLDALRLYEALDSRLVCCDIPNTDKFTLTLFFAIAERERELISIRTKAALRAKIAREKAQNPNFKLGNPKILKLSDNQQRKTAAEIAKKKQFNQAYSSITDIVFTLKKNTNLSLKEIANMLDCAGHKTSTGGKIHAMTIQRILARLENYIAS